MTNRKQKRKPEPPPKPEVPKVQHSPGGIKGRWLVNSLSFVLVILAVVVILISVGVSGYYYATVRDNLASRAATTSDTFRKYFTDTYDQFYTQAEATVTTFQDQDKFEQQFLDANGRILLSTSGLSGGGVASTEDASQALSGQKTAVFTGRDPLSGERVMSVTAPLLSARGDLVGGVRYITSLRIVERQIWIIVGCSLLACLLFLMLVVASNSYFIRSIVDPVLKINTIAKEIAAGRYGVRLQKTYDDEIGELCDTINYMSDEISRAERMKNDFISSVSHELRTPLTAIGGWSETLLAGGGEDPEEVMQGLTIIQKEAGRLTRMVEELLDFARIESGRMKLEIETFDMSIELYEAVYMYENLLKKSGIRLLYDEDVDANYYINGDRHRMKQVFLNILDNAAKYGGDVAMVWIDAHPDITLPGDPYPGYHAMAVTACMGHGDAKIVAELPAAFDPSKILFVGLRNWERGEIKARQHQYGIKHLTPEEVAADSDALRAWLKSCGASKVVVHFDMDVLDPAEIVAAVGTDPDGMKIEAVIRVINDIAAEKELVGLTVAEPMPRTAIRLRDMLGRLPLLE